VGGRVQQPRRDHPARHHAGPGARPPRVAFELRSSPCCPWSNVAGGWMSRARPGSQRPLRILQRAVRFSFDMLTAVSRGARRARSCLLARSGAPLVQGGPFAAGAGAELRGGAAAAGARASGRRRQRLLRQPQPHLWVRRAGRPAALQRPACFPLCNRLGCILVQSALSEHQATQFWSDFAGLLIGGEPACTAAFSASTSSCLHQRHFIPNHVHLMMPCSFNC
jgi:hypothetical protein